MQPAVLRDLLVILFHSVTPPGELTALRATDEPLADPSDLVHQSADRVGVIRRLCLNLSLCRDGEDWVIDTTRQKHKTSKVRPSTPLEPSESAHGCPEWSATHLGSFMDQLAPR